MEKPEFDLYHHYHEWEPVEELSVKTEPYYKPN